MSYGVASVEKNGGNLANMRLAFSADAGTAAVYKPLMPATDTTTMTDTHAGNFHQQQQQQPPSGVVSGMKRKRGRPRKYAPDADADGGVTMALHLLAPSQLPQQPITSTASVPTKKGRGRPPGSARKQHPSPSTYALGSARVGFTPHVITVQAGEDVLAKIMSFSQNGPRTVCILSANGTISNVTLRHAATSGGTVTYEGRFEILSLSGSFLLSETGGQRSRTGGLSVSLAGSDGRVLGGGVAGLFTAASPVQVVVGSFIAEGQKESKSGNQSEPLSAPAKLVPGTLKAGSPPSRGTLSESSGGPASPLNQSAGGCNNSNPQGLGNMPWK